MHLIAINLSHGETHLKFLFHKIPRLVCQQNRLADLRLLDALFGVGPMGNLIDVVADGRQRPQQTSVFARRPLPKLHPGDGLPDQYAGQQARDLAFLPQMGVFFIVQP